MALKNDFYVIKNDKDKVSTNVIKYSTKEALNGSIVGKVEVFLNDELLGYRNLYYKRNSVTKNKSFLDKLMNILLFLRGSND
jgi:hypothetical protein